MDQWGTSVVLDPAAGQILDLLTEGNGYQHGAAAVSPDGTWVALGGPKCAAIRRWRVLGR